VVAFIRGIIGFVFTILIAGFAAMNRESISVIWNPVDDAFVTVPLYLVILLSLAFGFICGGFVVWVNGAKVRRERRKQRREIKMLEKEVARLKEDKHMPIDAASVDVLQALPVAAVQA